MLAAIKPTLRIETQPMIPKAITPEFIRSSKSLSSDISEYVVHCICEYEETAEASFPIGLKRFWLIVCLESEILNGGFWQYFGNRTHQGIVQNDVPATIAALRTMGVHRLADLVDEAGKIWSRFLTDNKPGLDRKSALKIEEKMEEGFEPLEHRYDQMSEEFWDTIEQYIRTHDVEFLHSL